MSNTSGNEVEFQHDFLWVVSTAAHQVEGNLLHNDWTHFTTTAAIVERVNGNCDSWRGKFFQKNCWHLLDNVMVQNAMITITAHQETHNPIKLTATILRDRLQGT
ncbi:MAG: hypothetical protein ACRDHW_22980, partial [Ktedonobacteraceae bacterium]